MIPFLQGMEQLEDKLNFRADLEVDRNRASDPTWPKMSLKCIGPIRFIKHCKSIWLESFGLREKPHWPVRLDQFPGLLRLGFIDMK